jgi:hypothetical protein
MYTSLSFSLFPRSSRGALWCSSEGDLSIACSPSLSFFQAWDVAWGPPPFRFAGPDAVGISLIEAARLHSSAPSARTSSRERKRKRPSLIFVSLPLFPFARRAVISEDVFNPHAARPKLCNKNRRF